MFRFGWWSRVFVWSSGKRSPTQSMYTAASQAQIETKNPRVNLLVSKWQQVWLLALDRRRKLNDALDRLEEVKHTCTPDLTPVWDSCQVPSHSFLLLSALSWKSLPTLTLTYGGSATCAGWTTRNHVSWTSSAVLIKTRMGKSQGRNSLMASCPQVSKDFKPCVV